MKAQQNSTVRDFEGKQRLEQRFQNSAETRHRPITIISDGESEIQENIGDYARRRFGGRTLSATVTVKSAFRDDRNDSRQLWGINQLVYIEEPAANIRQNLLISEVEFSVSGQGFFSNLTMRLPQAFAADTDSSGQGTAKIITNNMELRRTSGEFADLARAFKQDIGLG
ncbi:MAG: hypothetical protein Pars92KO_32610 [Parasphingorhabdus sp.]